MILQRCTHPRPCYDDGKCHYKRECKHKAPLTNADRIRAMSDEELAAIIMCPIQFDEKAECIEGNCFQCSLKWLQQPAEEDNNDRES